MRSSARTAVLISGSVDQRVSGSAGQWISGSADQWISGSVSQLFSNLWPTFAFFGGLCVRSEWPLVRLQVTLT